MAKKHKQKQKHKQAHKSSQSQHAKQAQVVPTEANGSVGTQRLEGATVIIPDVPATKQVIASTQASSGQAVSATSHSQEYIRRDIFRIICTLAVLIVILLVLVVVNNKSSSLQTAGRKLASFAKLQN